MTTNKYRVVREAGHVTFVSREGAQIKLVPDNFSRLCDDIRRLTATHLVELEGCFDLPGSSLERVEKEKIVGSFLQNLWYQEIKGSVPDQVQRNHEQRLAAYLAKAKDNPVVLSGKVIKVYRSTGNKPVHLTKQEQIVFDIMSSDPLEFDDIIKRVEGKIKTKRGIRLAVSGILSRLKKENLIETDYVAVYGR